MLFTGIQLLDESRSDLFKMLRNLNLLWEKKNFHEIDMEFSSFKHSCHHYFHIMELVLLESGYPELEAHRREQELFMKKVNVMQLYYQNKGIDAILESVWYLNKHLINHLKSEDKKIIYYLTKHANTTSNEAFIQ